MYLVEQAEGVSNAHRNGAWAIRALRGSNGLGAEDDKGDLLGDIITGGCDGKLKTWRIQPTDTKPLLNRIKEEDTEVELVETPERLITPVRKYERHSLPIVDVAVSRDREIAVSTSLDGVLKIWTLSTGVRCNPSGTALEEGESNGHETTVKSMSHPNIQDTWCVAASRNGELAVTGGARGIMQVIDCEICTVERKFSVCGPSKDEKDEEIKHDGPMVMSIALSDDDRMALTGCADGSIVSSDIETGRVHTKFNTNPSGSKEHASHSIHGTPVRSVSYVIGDRNQTAVAARDDGAVLLIDVRAGDVISVLKAHDGLALAGASSTDGRRIATAGSDGLVKIWDRARHEMVFKSTRSKEAVWGVAWTAGDRHVVSVGDDGNIGAFACRGMET